MECNLFRLTVRDWMICCGEYIIIISVISYLFYDSFLSAVIFMPFLWIYIKRYRERVIAKRREELEKEFLKSLQSISTSLAAGLAPESALKETVEDLQKLFNSKSIIVSELKLISRRIDSGVRMEEALYDFAKKSNIEAIQDFALVFSVAKKSGGSLVKAISQCTSIMTMTNNTKEETKILIRSKQYEQRIMSIVPLGIVVYLRLSSGNYIDVLYHNLPGIMIMTICLFAYVLSIYIGERICKATI